MFKLLDKVCIGLGGAVLDTPPVLIVSGCMVAGVATTEHLDIHLFESEEVKTLSIPAYKYSHPTATVTRTVKLEDINTSTGKQTILAAAEGMFDSYDLPEGLATGILFYESGVGKLMKSKTGCLGWWQFSKKTAKAYELKDPMNFKESTLAAIHLMVDNRRALINNGVEINPLNLYLAHMIGAKGTTLLMKVLSGNKLNSKSERTLASVMKPNWSKHSMGSWNKSVRGRSQRFHIVVARNLKRFMAEAKTL